MESGSGSDVSMAMLIKETKFLVKKERRSRRRERQSDVVCAFGEG